MTLEEAEAIARGRRLDSEPAEDWLKSWHRTMPTPEPRREPRGLDTDIAAVVRTALKGERELLTEATGQAIGEVRDEIFDEIERLITQAVDKLRVELCIEFSRQLEALRLRADTQSTDLRAATDQMRDEFFKRLDLVRGQGTELRAELEKIAARKRRARSAAASPGSTLLPPAPLAGASLAPNGHGS
jgi:hypothetical protein